jgi:NNP family nitrate/nitrite transporter-like MFS transporter
LGGIVFLLISRYDGVNYGRLFWIMGTVTIVVNLAISIIRPIPKSQRGGR